MVGKLMTGEIKGLMLFVNLYIPQFEKWSHLLVDISVSNRCNSMLSVSLKKSKNFRTIYKS